MASSAKSETITNKVLTWINIENPTRETMAEVARQGYHFHELNIEDSLSKIEFPRLIDRRTTFLFYCIFLQLPNQFNIPISSPTISSSLFIIPAIIQSEKTQTERQFFNICAFRSIINICGKELFDNHPSRRSSTAQ